MCQRVSEHHFIYERESVSCKISAWLLIRQDLYRGIMILSFDHLNEGGSTYKCDFGRNSVKRIKL